MNGPDADAPLIARVKLGDVKAFEMLVVKYQRRIERLIGRMVRDVDLVPDIAQETFIRAYRAIPQFRGESAFYTWLYRIAVNTAKKFLMELKRDPLVPESSRAARDDDDETSRVENELTSSETPDAVLASKEIAEIINAAMEALPEELRQAITLREIEGLSYEEISEAMSCPIGTVRSRIFRARECVSKQRNHGSFAQAHRADISFDPEVRRYRRFYRPSGQGIFDRHVCAAGICNRHSRGARHSDCG